MKMMIDRKETIFMKMMNKYIECRQLLVVSTVTWTETLSVTTKACETHILRHPSSSSVVAFISMFRLFQVVTICL